MGGIDYIEPKFDPKSGIGKPPVTSINANLGNLYATATASSTQSLANNTTVVVDYDTFDTNGLGMDKTDGRVIIIKSGFYLVTMSAEFTNVIGTDTRRIISIRKNGSTFVTAEAIISQGQPTVNATYSLFLKKDDYIEGALRQTSGATSGTVTEVTQNFLQIIQLF